MEFNLSLEKNNLSLLPILTQSTLNPPHDLISFLYISMMVASFLATLVYVYYNWKNGLFGRLMSITFLLITYGLFTSFNAAQGFLIYLPHIARTGYLALLIVTPLLYLSLYRGLSKTTFKKIDFLHFLPALLYFINFIPFFILSSDEKVKLISLDHFTNFDEGWFFPRYFVIVLSVGQIIFYLYLATKNILLPSLRSSKTSPDEKRFLYTFYSYLFLLFVPPSVTYWTGYSGINPGSPVLITYISSQLIFFVVLLNQPKLIFFPFFNTHQKEPQVQSDEESVSDSDNEVLSIPNDLDNETLQIIEQISEFFENEKPFLNFEFDQKELAEKLNLSNYLIRNSLKKSYGLSFTEFVNKHRIKFLKEKLASNPNWRNFTMATLANSIGFKSTNSLYLAFKKESKLTPKDYIDQLKKN